MADEKLGLEDRLTVYNRLKDLFGFDLKTGDCIKTICDQKHRVSLITRKPPPMIRAARDWHQKILSGVPLSRAMAGWMPAEICSLVAAGEKSNRQVEAMEMAIRLEKGKEKIRSAVWDCVKTPFGHLMNPLILILVGGLLVIPKFSAVIPPEDWVGPSRAMKIVFDVLISVEMLGFLIFLAFLAFLAYRSLSRWTGEIRTQIADRFFPWNYYKVLVGSTYLSSVGSLLQADYQEPKAIEELLKTNGGWYGWKLERIHWFLNRGQTLAEAMVSADAGFPSESFNEDLMLVSRYGDLSRKMNEIAVKSLDDSVNNLLGLADKMKILSQVFGGIVFILVIGGMGSLSISAQNSLSGIGG